MRAVLYKTTSPKNAINKVLVESKEVNIKLKDYVSILNPTLDLMNFNGVFLYNYIYIPTFSRFYFINEITVLTSSVVRIACSVDVLETWKIDILNSIGHMIKRTGGNMNGAIIEKTGEVEHDIIVLNSPFTLQDYFIVTTTRGSEYIQGV